MHREIHGPSSLLQDFRTRLQVQLEKSGFKKGPRLGSQEGWVCDYIKDGSILSIELAVNEESQEAQLTVESERDIFGFADIWDSALITMKKDIVQKLESYAIDKEKLKRE